MCVGECRCMSVLVCVSLCLCLCLTAFLLLGTQHLPLWQHLEYPVEDISVMFSCGLDLFLRFQARGAGMSRDIAILSRGPVKHERPSPSMSVLLPRWTRCFKSLSLSLWSSSRSYPPRSRSTWPQHGELQHPHGRQRPRHPAQQGHVRVRFCCLPHLRSLH